MEINFNQANVGGASGDNTLSSLEILNYMKSINPNLGEEAIKLMMKSLIINVDGVRTSVDFDFDDKVSYDTDTNLFVADNSGSLIDFDFLEINDTNSQATAFQIFIADSNGLTVNANSAGSLTSDSVGSVTVTDSNSDGTNTVSKNVKVSPTIILSRADFDTINNAGLNDAEIATIMGRTGATIAQIIELIGHGATAAQVKNIFAAGAGANFAKYSALLDGSEHIAAMSTADISLGVTSGWSVDQLTTFQAYKGNYSIAEIKSYVATAGAYSLVNVLNALSSPTTVANADILIKLAVSTLSTGATVAFNGSNISVSITRGDRTETITISTANIALAKTELAQANLKDAFINAYRDHLDGGSSRAETNEDTQLNALAKSILLDLDSDTLEARLAEFKGKGSSIVDDVIRTLATSTPNDMTKLVAMAFNSSTALSSDYIFGFLSSATLTDFYNNLPPTQRTNLDIGKMIYNSRLSADNKKIMFAQLATSIIGTTFISISDSINKHHLAASIIASSCGQNIDVPPTITVDAINKTVTLKYGEYLGSNTVTINIEHSDDELAAATQILNVGGTLAWDVFVELRDAQAITSNLDFVKTLIFNHPTLETASIMLNQLPDSTSVNSVVEYLYNLGETGKQRLADLMLAGRRTTDIITYLTPSRLATVLGKISDDGIANLFRSDSASGAAKFKLIQTMMNQDYVDSNGATKKCFNRALDGMNIQYMAEAMGKIMAQLGPNSINDYSVHADVKAFVAQMVTFATTRGAYGAAALMFNSLAGASGFGDVVGQQVIKNLCDLGKFAEIGKLIGGATSNMSAINVNKVFDHLQTLVKLQNVVDAMSVQEWFNVLDEGELDNANIVDMLTALAATDHLTGTNLSDKFTKLGRLLLKPLKDNTGKYGDISAKLIKNMRPAQVTGVLNTCSTQEIANIIKKFNVDGSIDSMDALANVGRGLAGVEKSIRFAVIDSFDHRDMARVVANWATHVAVIGSSSTDKVLNAVLVGVTQNKMNDWLSKLSVKWSTVTTSNYEPPCLSGLGKLGDAQASWIQAGTAQYLLGAVDSVMCKNIVKAAYVQEVLSNMGAGAFDFSNGINADTIKLLAGVLVDDPQAFLNILGLVARTITISQADCDVLNRLLETTIGVAPAVKSIKLIEGVGWLEVSKLSSSGDGNSKIWRQNDPTNKDATAFPEGAPVSIIMNVGTVEAPLEIHISTSMTLVQKQAVIVELLAKYKSGKVHALDIANLFKAIANYGSGNKAAGTTLLMNGILDSVYKTLSQDDKNEIMYQLALTNEGQDFINTYVLTNTDLLSGMLTQFSAYCLRQTNGAQVLAALINTNFSQTNADGNMSSAFSNLTMALILRELKALGGTAVTNTAASSVINLLNSHTLVALLNEDDSVNVVKDMIRASIIATRTSAELADIFNENIAYRTIGDQEFGGLISKETDALLLAINSSAGGPAKLADMFKAMTPAQVKSVIGRATGTALTAACVALNILIGRTDVGDKSKGAEISAFLLTGENMIRSYQEALLSNLGEPQLKETLTKMSGEEVAGLIQITEGYDLTIMRLAANGGLTAEKLGQLALSLSVENKELLLAILADTTHPSSTSLNDVMEAMGVDKVRTLVQSPGLTDVSQNFIFKAAIKADALGESGAVELLLLGEPSLSVDLKQQFLNAIDGTDDFDQLIAAVVNYGTSNGDGLGAALINIIGDSTLQDSIMNSITGSIAISGAQKGNILVNLLSTDLMNNFIEKLDTNLGNVMEDMGTDAVLALLETPGLNPDSWDSIMTQAANVMKTNSAGAQAIANAFVACLNRNNNPEFVSKFALMLKTNAAFPNISAQIATAFEGEGNWNPAAFATLALEMINLTTALENDFRALNSLLLQINGVDAAFSFVSLRAEAESTDNGDLAGRVQGYLRESLLSVTSGNVNAPTNALGGIQFQSVLFAASQNLDKNGSLEIFGSAPISIDWVVLAAENMYQVAGTDERDELASVILQGIIGFDITAGTDDAEYYNNIKRIAFIAQGGPGSLLSAIGSSSAMSEFLRFNSGIMTNSVSESLSKINNEDFRFIVQNDSGSYYVKFTPLTFADLGVINEDNGNNYANNFPNQYRVLNLLGSSDRDNFGVIFEDTNSDYSDWIFTEDVDAANEG